MQNLKRTPLHRCHLQLGAKMVPFAGFNMPVQYTGVLEEARAVRSQCGLFDVSHMGQFSIHGKDALTELYRLVTNDLLKLQQGQAQYNMLCKEDGGTLDDLVIYYRAPEHIYICVNAANRKKDFDWLKNHLTSKLSLVDESDDTALLALQGPAAEDILLEMSDSKIVKNLKYYWGTETLVCGKACFLSRTGYTGEDGFELYLKADDSAIVWEEILERGRKRGCVPVGLGARDTLRLEMGYALYGHELSEQRTPLSAGLGWVVKLSRSTPFIGCEAMRKESDAGGPKEILKAFVVEDRRTGRQGYRIFSSDKTRVGEISSGTFSPHRQSPIALGFVASGFASDQNFFIEVRESLVPATAVKLPFVPSKTKGAKP